MGNGVVVQTQTTLGTATPAVPEMPDAIFLWGASTMIEWTFFRGRKHQFRIVLGWCGWLPEINLSNKYMPMAYYMRGVNWLFLGVHWKYNHRDPWSLGEVFAWLKDADKEVSNVSQD